MEDIANKLEYAPVDPEIERENAIKRLKEDVAAKSEEELIAYLESLNILDVYVILRDYIALPQEKRLRALKDREDKVLYQKYQNLKKSSKEAWDYDNSVALKKDVNKVATEVYTVLLKMIRASNDDIGAQIVKIQNSLNAIEDHIGIPRTAWVDETPTSVIDPDDLKSAEPTEEAGETEVNEDASSENEQGIS